MPANGRSSSLVFPRRREPLREVDKSGVPLDWKWMMRVIGQAKDGGYDRSTIARPDFINVFRVRRIA